MKTQTEFGTAAQSIEQDPDFVKPERETKLVRIDLACGQTKKEGFIGFDLVHGDVRADLLQFPWPIETGSVYEFFCSHFVEHIPHERKGWDKDGLVMFMDEVYRCLMPLGTITIVHPYYTSIRAHQDPTHHRYLCENTWDYFSKEWRENAKLDHYAIESNFKIINKVMYLNPEWESRAEEAKEWARRHYWNVVDDMAVILQAVK